MLAAPAGLRPYNSRPRQRVAHSLAYWPPGRHAHTAIFEASVASAGLFSLSQGARAPCERIGKRRAATIRSTTSVASFPTCAPPRPFTSQMEKMLRRHCGLIACPASKLRHTCSDHCRPTARLSDINSRHFLDSIRLPSLVGRTCWRTSRLPRLTLCRSWARSREKSQISALLPA